MKKLVLFLIALVATVTSLTAQVVSPQLTMLRDDWQTSLTFSATTDTASVGGAWSKIIISNKPMRLFYDMRVKVTEVSATTSTAIALKARKFDTDAWTTLTTITYRGTGTDTTASFSEASTASQYGQWQIVVTPANGKVKLSSLKQVFKY